MGCLFGATLSPHAAVTLVGRWAAQIEALTRAPLRLVYPDGREQAVPLQATSDLDQIDPVDIALILTKAPHTAAAARDAAAILALDGLAITLQNGIGNDDLLRRALPPERVALGVTTLGAATHGQTGVVYVGGTGTTYLARPASDDSPLQRFAALLEQAGLDVTLTDDIVGMLWGKLAINAAINPLTAVLGVPNGALLDSSWARGLLREAAEEVGVVAAARGIRLPFEDPASQAETVARLTGPNQSSMWQDVQRGVPTEIDAICGAVARLGAEVNVPTPANRLLHALVKALEETAAHRPRPS